MSKINETNYPRRTQANYEDTDMLVIQKAGGNTYTTRIEDLREDCQETLAPALDTMRENLATIEGSTASKAYAKGDFLVFGGRLCKAKTSIASGATLVLDTNIELDSVGDELSSLSSDLTNKTPTIYSKTISGETIDTAWGGVYQKAFDITTDADWRDKDVSVSFVPLASSPTAVWCAISAMTATKITVMLIRPTTASGVSGTLYARCYK
jgi:hypothetical protein